VIRPFESLIGLNVKKLSFHRLAPLFLFSLTLTALLTTSLVVGVTPSESFGTLAAILWSLLLAFWLAADFRRWREVPCFDFGFFCYVLLPIAVPMYCFWSRGWRGALLLAAIVGLWLAPYIIATFVWFALYR
jgi:hypothetical protein